MRIQGREPVAHQLALVDERVMHLCTRAARAADNADLLDIAQSLQAGAQLGSWIVQSDVRGVSQRSNGVASASQRMPGGADLAVLQDVDQGFRSKADALQRGLVGRLVIHADVP